MSSYYPQGDPNSQQPAYQPDPQASLDQLVLLQQSTAQSVALIARQIAQIQAMQANSVQPIKVIDVEMRFGSMVSFVIKWAIAAVPAAILLFLLFAMVSAILAGMLAALP